MRTENTSKEKASEATDIRFGFRANKELTSIQLLSILLINPGILILLVDYLFGIEWNVLIVYVVMDTILFILWRVHRKRVAEEKKRWEEAGDRTEIIREKIAELKIMEERLCSSKYRK